MREHTRPDVWGDVEMYAWSESISSSYFNIMFEVTMN